MAAIVEFGQGVMKSVRDEVRVGWGQVHTRRWNHLDKVAVSR